MHYLSAVALPHDVQNFPQRSRVAAPDLIDCIVLRTAGAVAGACTAIHVIAAAQRIRVFIAIIIVVVKVMTVAIIITAITIIIITAIAIIIITAIAIITIAVVTSTTAIFAIPILGKGSTGLQGQNAHQHKPNKIAPQIHQVKLKTQTSF
jgi:hypothetical protein